MKWKKEYGTITRRYREGDFRYIEYTTPSGQMRVEGTNMRMMRMFARQSRNNRRRFIIEKIKRWFAR